MKNFKPQNAYLPLALLLTVFMAGCNSGGGSSSTPAATDTTAPTVTLTAPADKTEDVAINSKITATFSEDMASTTLTDTTFTVTGPADAVVGGKVTYAAALTTAVFTPTYKLTQDTTYTAKITTGAPLADNKVWTFKTGASTDNTPPTVVTTVPDNSGTVTEVRTTQTVSATFSEAMDPATIIAANFTLVTGTNPPVPGTLAYAGTTVIFTPASKLATKTTYTVTITGGIGGVHDLAGIAMNSDEVWSFTTVTTDVAGPQPPVLGEAGRFLILASQKITTTTGSVLSNGDLGILDQARTYYNDQFTETNLGYFDQLTDGYTYAHDDMPPYVIPVPYASTIAFLDQTRTDLGIAYRFLAADPNPGSPTIACPTQLGGLTLTQGVYKTGADVLVTDGPLVLDAQFDEDAVFIFSIDGNLTVGAPSGAISLINNAQAKNVYFRTGGKTTIEAGIDFFGNVFAWSQVNVLTDADIHGRLFAVTEQVTLDSDTVTAP